MKFIAAFSILATALLSGCASMSAAQNAFGMVNSARNAQSAYHAYGSVKDLTNARPLFQGYNSVLVLADIQPRDNAANLPMVFASNMAVYTGAAARTMRAPLQVCQAANQCAGRVLVVQFKEDAYDRNIVQRLTMGDKIRGKLFFLDQASGQIVDEKRAEMSDTYASLASMTSGFIMTSMYKSYPPASEAEGQRIGNELEKIPVVAPQYERILGKAS